MSRTRIRAYVKIKINMRSDMDGRYGFFTFRSEVMRFDHGMYFVSSGHVRACSRLNAYMFNCII